jgi:hypothetical protein
MEEVTRVPVHALVTVGCLCAKAVLDVLKRHFMVVLIDEYLTSHMYKQLLRQAEPSDTALTVVVTWIATATLPRTCWRCSCSMFVDGDIPNPDYLCRLVQAPRTAEVPHAAFCCLTP